MKNNNFLNIIIGDTGGLRETFDLNTIIKYFFITFFMIAPILSNKIATVFGFNIPVGMFFVTIFMLGFIDVINHRQGIVEARKMIIQAVLVQTIFFLTIIPLAIALPSAPFFQGQEAYANFLGQSIRFMIASNIIVIIGQYLFDTRIFHYFRKLNWFPRVIASDFTSQIFQTTGFILMSFAGKGIPLIPLILSSFALRMILSVIKAIILYPLVIRVKK